MKENEKQAIEEMAAVIGAAIEFDELDFGMDEKTEIIAEKAAKAFYKEGYRKQEWVSVEERLPEIYQDVLWSDGRSIGIDFRTFDGKWYDGDCHEPTHWTPLPEAPKGGAE